MVDPTISVQLYSVRAVLAHDLDGPLARLATLGFSTVEAFDFVGRAHELRHAFERHGLRAATGHAALASDTLTTASGDVVPAPTNAEVFASAAMLGLEIVIDPYTDPLRWKSRDDIADIANRLNAAAALAAEHGLRVGYHNHWQEFDTPIDGAYGLDLLAERLDEAVVLEVDLYWATVGGAVDLPAVIERLGDRVVAVHVKDGTLEPAKSSLRPPTDQVPAGSGCVALTPALDAAGALEYAVIEFDAVDGDVFDAIAASREFLVARGLR